MRSRATFTSLEWPPRYPKEMSETTVLVIRSDGGLVFPEQVPSGWARADHLAPDAPLPVRRAVADAIATAATGGSGVARTVLDEATHHELVVVVINAVPLRSSLVTVDELERAAEHRERMLSRLQELAKQITITGSGT